MPHFVPLQPAKAPPIQPWRNSFLHRLMLATLISQMENRLLAESSATRTLEDWLQNHKLLDRHETLHAERETGAHAPCPPDLIDLLGSPVHQSASPLRYRKIRLVGHGCVFSQAENWFVPECLTKTMTDALEQTDTPFGRVVSPLRFTRQLIRRETLWSPLPDLWEMHSQPPADKTEAEPLALPPYLFRHIALLRTHSGTPFSLVVETYTPQAFAFTPPTPE